MVLGLDVHIIAITPPQAAGSTLCVVLGQLEPVTLAYAIGSGNFSLLDIHSEVEGADVYENEDANAANDQQEVDAEAVEGGEAEEAGDAVNGKQKQKETRAHGGVAGEGRAHHAHRLQQQQEEFISTLDQLSLSTLGRHGKMLSCGRCSRTSGEVNIALVPPGSYIRHTNDDPYALENRWMLLLAHQRLKLRVYDTTGAVHAASLSSYSASITLSISVYDVLLDPSKVLRMAPTGRVVVDWKARARAWESGAGAGINGSTTIINDSSNSDDTNVLSSPHTSKTGLVLEEINECIERIDSTAWGVQPPSLSEGQESDGKEEEEAEWQPHSPVYDSLESNSDEEEDEDEAAARRIERDRRELSAFMKEWEENENNPNSKNVKWTTQTSVQKQKQALSAPLASVEEVLGQLTQARDKAAAAVRKSMEKIQWQRQQEEEKRKIQVLQSKEKKSNKQQQQTRIPIAHHQSRQQGQYDKGKKQSVQHVQFEQPPMNLRLSAYPRDVQMTTTRQHPPAIPEPVVLEASKLHTRTANEASIQELVVGRGRVISPQELRKRRDVILTAATTAAAARIQEEKDRKTAILRKNQGEVGKNWRRHVHNQRTGKGSTSTSSLYGTKTSDTAPTGGPRDRGVRNRGTAKADRQVLRKGKDKGMYNSNEMAAVAATTAYDERDATARLLGGLGKTRPVVVHASYTAAGGTSSGASASTNSRVRSSYELNSHLPTTRVKEHGHVSRGRPATAEELPMSARTKSSMSTTCSTNAVDQKQKQKQKKKEEPAHVPASVPLHPKTLDLLPPPVPCRAYEPIIYFHR